MGDRPDSLLERTRSICDLVQKICHVPVNIGRTAFTQQYKGLFISLWPTSFEEVPKDLREYVDKGELFYEKVRGLGILSYEVQAFGTGSNAVLRRLKVSFASSIWLDAERTCRVAYSSSSEVRYVPSPLLDSNYEERAAMDMQFYAALPEEYSVDYFDKERIDIKGYINGNQLKDVSSDWVGTDLKIIVKR